MTIAVTEDIDKVRNLLTEFVQTDKDLMTDPSPIVAVTQLNDYNIALELRVWLKDERKHLQKRLELRERIFQLLTENQIDMPFETIQLAPHVVKMIKNSPE